MKLNLLSHTLNLAPIIPKVQEISEDDKSDHSETKKSTLLFNILHSKYQEKPESVHKLIKQQLQGLFKINTQNKESALFYEKLANSMHQTFHEKFKYPFYYYRNNYHKFLITQEVLDLSYQSKGFLLNVFRDYDNVFHYQKINKKTLFKEPSFQKKSTWSQAQTLIDPVQIKNYQMKMYLLYRGQFLDIVSGISSEKDNCQKYLQKSSLSLKRGLIQSDHESQGKNSMSSCECKRKKIKLNNSFSLDNDELQKQRIEVKAFN